VEVVASLSQGRTAVAQCGLFTHISVPVIFEPPCIKILEHISTIRVLYRNAGKILTQFGQSYLPNILVKNPDGGNMSVNFNT